MSETVTPVSVGETNDYGWSTVKLSDGREVETKDSNIISRVREMLNQDANAEIGIGQGKYDGRLFLNKFAGIGQTPQRRAGGNGSSTGTQRRSGSDNDARQKSIQAQWAIGRAVETLIGSGLDYTVPFSGQTQADFETQVDYFLTLAQKKSA